MPIAADERGEAAPFEIQDRRAAVFDLRWHRAKHSRARRHADHRLSGDIQQRIEPVAGQPTEKSAPPLACGIEQIVIRSAAGHVARDERHLHADQLAERPLRDHPPQSIGNVVVPPHVAGLKDALAARTASTIGCAPARPGRHRLLRQHVLAGP